MAICWRWMVLLGLAVPVCLASVKTPEAGAKSGWNRERTVLGTSYRHEAEDAVPRSCERVRPAQALATPDPLLGGRSRVAVSFVIGTDGRVHSPVVLESTGAGEDSNVLEAVKAWRYRPATCNAVPAETEGRVEFSSR